MMDKLALEMETFEEILERFEVDVAQAKLCGDYSQMVRKAFKGRYYGIPTTVHFSTCCSTMEERHTRPQ